MSSSLSSLILIAVVWLLLLAPLFLRNQSPVRKTTKVLSETRVLHEGGTGIGRRRKRPLPAESLYHADVEEEIELVEAEPVDVVIDDTGRESKRTVRRRAAAQARDAQARDAEAPDTDALDGSDAPDRADGQVPVADVITDPRLVRTPGVIEGEIVGYRPLDDEDTGEFAPVDPDAAVDDSDAPEDVGRVVAAEDTRFTSIALDTGDDDTDADTDSATVAETVADADADTEDADADADAVRPTGRRFSPVPDAYIRGGDIDVSVGTGEDVAEEADRENPGVVADDDSVDSSDAVELTDEEIDYASARRGRGFYDPVASQHLADMRQTRRKRVLSVLAALCVVAVVAAVVLGGAMWLAVVASLGLSGVYLYYLRRQVVEEARLRRRRIARMRRARQGVRSTDDRELGVPDRLLRPGAVVLESDDADPEFADLDYADHGYDSYRYDAAAYDDYITPDDGYDHAGHIRAV
ncbi:MAG: divisome protein SepX/GlpR [Mycobacteriaceae bacterium]|uniref:divisome protein SepX/GlpR n=1 Tax=Corynebacterium sp. TaxID=1720 RepID=UPI003F9B6D7A